MKILIIDDNIRLAQRTKERLRRWYVIETAHSGEDGLQALRHSKFDLVILDLGLPGIHGSSVCAHIKQSWPETAILVVTGEDSLISKVSLLDTGADDYITKPFELSEIQARIRAIFRRKQSAPYRNTIKIDDLEIDPNTHTVIRGGKTINLRRKEYNILEYLCMNPGRILTKEMIVNQAWPTSSEKWTNSIGVHIKQIRDKIDRDSPNKLIKTVYGLGYMVVIPHADNTKEGDLDNEEFSNRDTK